MLGKEDENQLCERRVQALAERNEKRKARFLDARHRTIGIDKDSLDQQVEEKRRQHILIQEEKQREAEWNSLLILQLTDAERKAQEIQERKSNEVKATLLQQQSEEKNNAIKRGGPIDVNLCGPSSLQRFSGEDEELAQRKKNQQEQVKNWYAWQIYERDAVKKSEEEQNQHYFDSVLRQDEVQEHIKQQISNARVKKAKDIQQENLMMAQRAKQQKLDNTPDTRLLLESPIDRRGYSDRVTTEEFRGFGVDQIRSIYKDNITIMEEKLTRKRREEEEEKKRVAKEEHVRKEMEQIAELHDQRRLTNNRALAEAWEQQRNELRVKQRQMKEDRFGKITHGFFQRFGTSCR